MLTKGQVYYRSNKEAYDKYRQTHREQINKWKEENITPEVQSKYYKKWYDENGSEYKKKLPYNEIRARSLVNVAVRRGDMGQLPCMVCGDLTVQGHHYQGYDPEHYLDVKWLCSKHHKQEHKKLQRTGEYE